MKHIRKVLALMLALCVIVGLIPSSAYASTENDTTHYMMFATDRHNDTDIIGKLLTNMESDIGDGNVEYVGLGGDMVDNSDSYNASTVLNEITNVASNLDKTSVDLLYANHDVGCNDDVDIMNETSGLWYTGEDYYVYGVIETDVKTAESAQTAAENFVTWANGLEDTDDKAIIVLSHYPLHAKRGDNAGAGYWHNALNTVATGSTAGGDIIRDVVFLHGHNHTVDTQEYFYKVNDTVSIESYVDASGASVANTDTIETYDSEIEAYASANGTDATIYYTYATAGYLSETRGNGQAMLVGINDDAITFTKYSSGNESDLGTVTRVASASSESTEKTVTSISVNGAKEYTVGDFLNITVTATYSDGSTATVTGYEVSDVDMTTAGNKTVTVTYKNSSAEYTFNVVEADEGDNDVDSTLPAPTTATVTGATTTETKDVYVLVDTPTANKQYIIASSGSAGSAYALKENTTTGESITINAASGNITAPYIETSDETIMWNAASGMTFQSESGSYYLRQSQSSGSRRLSFSTSQSTNWTVGTNSLSYKRQRNTYYVSGGSTWSLSDSSANVYFYEKQNVTVTTSANGIYSIAGNPAEVSKVVVAETTTTLGSTLTFVLESGETTTTDTSAAATYTEYQDEAGIISGINGNTVTFTGKYGTAYVKVSHTVTVNGTSYTVDNYILVEAKEPTYSVVITETKDSVEVEVDDTIAIKGVESGDTYELNQIVYYEDTNGNNPYEEFESTKITWVSSNANIATVSKDGAVTFTGNEGTVQITVYYEYTDGKSVQDVVTFSVSKNQYVIPSDGTDDFPEYPNQGAIRFDKTAVAVGNFSQTGIANVELSMTGVPYGTSTKTDVVVMVDMTASMSDDDVRAAELAVKELIESLVYDEENDKYDSNIQLFVDTFGSGSSDSAVTIKNFHNCTTISTADELTAAKEKIDFTQSSQGGGTRYNVALADVYETLNREGHAENQFVVFVSDGVATAYSPLTNGEQGTTITGSNSKTASLCAGWFDDEGEVTDEFETEYYTYMIKTAGIPVYTVGANLTALSDAADLLNHMSSNYSPDGKTSTGETKYSFFCTTSGGITDEVLEIFHGIGQDIKEAATNVVVEDKIADEYTMNFALPSGVTAEEAGMDDFYIQVVGYELDDNNERKDNPEVIEKFLFNSDGTITHTIGTAACGDTCTHVTYTDGVVTAIDGTYFDYSSTDDGEFITWKADKLDRTELALQYFVYLDNSAGDVAAADQVEAGTYPTNEYATLTYTNFNGNECQQYFPIPSLTWNGAQVTYVFYLVNENGEPVNRAGKVVPFAEAVYVTDPVTYDVTWNEETGTENMLAENLFASAQVPNVYELYDKNAYYEIRVYQTEGVDQGNNVKNYNYFIINGSASDLTSCETTKVFNTKAGNRYDEYGVYSAQAKDSEIYTTDSEGNAATITVNYQATDIDYANTTVAFAVVWKPALVEDTVVIDYGLDVVVNVYENDGLAAGVTGVMSSKPSNVEMNSGTYKNAVGTPSITDDDGIWTASKESLTSVRLKQNEMGMNEPAIFYYEAGVNYYTYDASGNATLNTTNMYSSVTVIPATTIYYEDDFVSFTSYTKNDEGAYVEDATSQWTDEGTTTSATQDVDRPGVNQAMGSDYDADNLYGYDSAYTDSSLYSLGSAHKIDVTSKVRGEATFSFYGTGFDIVGLTSSTTGTLIVQVTDADGNNVKTSVVDTYYGYAYGDSDEDGTDEWYTVDSNSPNALYQVPVMKISDLPYGQYTVTLTAGYNSSFDHTSDDSGDYTLYIDAIRIYDPANDGASDETVKDVYLADGEGYPEYTELRDQIITKATFDSSNNDSVSGIVFIDGATTDPDETVSIADYSDYGPNNELYLAYGEAIAFDLNATATSGDVSSVQLGIKSVEGTGSVEVYGIDSTGTKTACLNKEINTATDMYYDITALNGKTVVIKNAGDSNGAMISLTNIKTTYTEKQSVQDDDTDTASYSLLSISRSTANYALMSFAVEEEEIVEPEVFEPETFEISVSDTSVKAGQKVKVTVTTSTDVAYVTVDGAVITEYKEKNGKRTWSTKISATEVGEMEIEAVAYNENDVASNSITKVVTVTKKQNGKRNGKH